MKTNEKNNQSGLPFDEYRQRVYNEVGEDLFYQMDCSGFMHSGVEVQLLAFLYCHNFRPFMAAHFLELFYTELREQEQKDE